MTQCPIKSAVRVSHEEATAAMARFGFSCDRAERYRVPGFPGCILVLRGNVWQLESGWLDKFDDRAAWLEWRAYTRSLKHG